MWFRIDKANGAMAPCSSVNVLRAAQGSYHNASAVLETGRFSTAFAIYTRRDQMTPDERTLSLETK